MSEQELCEVCSKPATRAAFFRDKYLGNIQKAFRICDQATCLDRVVKYAFERGEIPEIRKLERKDI